MIKYILREKYFMRYCHVSHFTIIKFVKIVKKSGPLPTVKTITRNDIIVKFNFLFKKC